MATLNLFFLNALCLAVLVVLGIASAKFVSWMRTNIPTQIVRPTIFTKLSAAVALSCGVLFAIYPSKIVFLTMFACFMASVVSQILRNLADPSVFAKIERESTPPFSMVECDSSFEIVDVGTGKILGIAKRGDVDRLVSVFSEIPPHVCNDIELTYEMVDDQLFATSSEFRRILKSGFAAKDLLCIRWQPLGETNRPGEREKVRETDNGL